MVGEGNKLDEFLNKGEVSQAAQLALVVLKVANAESDCGQGLSILVIIVVRACINYQLLNFGKSAVSNRNTLGI